MNSYLSRASEVLERINQLAAISEDDNFICRRFGSAASKEASLKVMSWMIEAGLDARIDNIGNVRGKMVSSISGAKTMVIASHIDTVINAGKFDGPLGVIIGLDVLKLISDANPELPFNLELVAFSDEEGVRFHSTFLGSKVLAGSFEASLLDRQDDGGTTLGEVIKAIGGNVSSMHLDAYTPGDLLGYFEIHIEQGPVLYEKNIPVAIVSAIAGQVRIEIVFKGTPGHAGTVPMDKRKDALCCAAEFIIETENYGRGIKNKIVVTIGKLNILHSASNVIPGEVVCSLDLRSADNEILTSSLERLHRLCEAVCNRRMIIFEWKMVQQTQPVQCDKDLNQLLLSAIKKAGCGSVSLVSGAGHDAVAMSTVAPVAMLFVKCFEGISHNPLENVELGDIASAIEVSHNFIQRLIDTHHNA